VRLFILGNLNALITMIGFVVLVLGVSMVWSGGVACLVAGSLLMLGGSWPFVVLTLRKRQS
jgi:hypothetical protein